MNGIHFGRRCAAALGVMVIALSLGACGDPLVVLGDTPGQVRIIAGGPDSAGTHVDSIARRTRFLFLSSVAFHDESGLLYVADRGSSRQVNGVTTRVARIFAVTSAGRLTLIADGGGCATTLPCIVDPVSMAMMGDAILIADATGHRLLRFQPATRAITTLAGTGVPDAAVDGAPAAATPINAPAGVVTADGVIHVSERGADRVWRISADGSYVLVAGGGGTEITAEIGATAARLRQPSGLAIANGVLYIADTGNHSVEALDLASGLIRRVVGDGFAGFAGDGGLATSARLLNPADVSVNAQGTLLYIADTGNNRVRVLDLASGVIHTYAGTATTAYNGDRLAAASTSLRTPIDLAGSTRQFLYIVDQGHSIVRRATLGF